MDIVRLARATSRRPIRHPRPAEPEERPASSTRPAHVIERGQAILDHKNTRSIIDQMRQNARKKQ